MINIKILKADDYILKDTAIFSIGKYLVSTEGCSSEFNQVICNSIEKGVFVKDDSVFFNFDNITYINSSDSYLKHSGTVFGLNPCSNDILFLDVCEWGDRVSVDLNSLFAVSCNNYCEGKDVALISEEGLICLKLQCPKEAVLEVSLGDSGGRFRIRKGVKVIAKCEDIVEDSRSDDYLVYIGRGKMLLDVSSLIK